MDTPQTRLSVLRGYPMKQGASPGFSSQLFELFDKVSSPSFHPLGGLIRSKGGIGRTSTWVDWAMQNKDKYEIVYIGATKSQVNESITYARRLGEKGNFPHIAITAEVASKYFNFLVPSKPRIVMIDNADAIPAEHISLILSALGDSCRIMATCINNTHGAAECAPHLSVMDVTDRMIVDRAAQELSGMQSTNTLHKYYQSLQDFLAKVEKPNQHNGISFSSE